MSGNPNKRAASQRGMNEWYARKRLEEKRLVELSETAAIAEIRQHLKTIDQKKGKIRGLELDLGYCRETVEEQKEQIRLCRRENAQQEEQINAYKKRIMRAADEHGYEKYILEQRVNALKKELAQCKAGETSWCQVM